METLLRIQRALEAVGTGYQRVLGGCTALRRGAASVPVWTAAEQEKPRKAVTVRDDLDQDRQEDAGQKRNDDKDRRIVNAGFRQNHPCARRAEYVEQIDRVGETADACERCPLKLCRKQRNAGNHTNNKSKCHRTEDWERDELDEREMVNSKLLPTPQHPLLHPLQRAFETTLENAGHRSQV